MDTSYNSSVKTFDTQFQRQSLLDLISMQNTTESLPFTVKIVQSIQEMEKAIGIRHAAYARHVPDLAEILKEPEKFDFDEDAIVLLAESKLDGSALGSMRVQTNLHKKLKLEHSVTLPPWLQNCSLAEAGRLGIVGSRMGRIVKSILFKAYYEYCLHEGIEWMVITARAPVDKTYEALLFRDVFDSKEYIPIKHDDNMACRIMAFHVPTAEQLWRINQHPLYNLVFLTRHPDIDISMPDAILTAQEPPRMPYQASAHAI